MALLLPPLRGRDRRRAPLDVARQRERRPPDLRRRSSARSIRTLTWMPREPDVFGQPTSPTASRASCTTRATSRTCDQGTPGHRVEVDAQLVGMLHVVGADGVRVEVDAAEVGDPREARRLVDHDLVGRPARRERQRRDAHPLGPVVGRPLLEERLLVDPVDEPLERHRPSPNAGQRAVGDGEEVAHDVELRVARHGEVDLVGVRDRDLPPADLEDLLARRHAPILAATGKRRRARAPSRMSISEVRIRR